MKMLQIMLASLRCPGGALLEPDIVLKMVKLCFDFSRQAKLSELLRKMSEHFLMQMVPVSRDGGSADGGSQVLTVFSSCGGSKEPQGPQVAWQSCLTQVQI